MHETYLHQKLLTIYLDFKFNQAVYILASIPIPGRQLDGKPFHFILTLSRHTFFQSLSFSQTSCGLFFRPDFSKLPPKGQTKFTTYFCMACNNGLLHFSMVEKNQKRNAILWHSNFMKFYSFLCPQSFTESQAASFVQVSSLAAAAQQLS